jgi:hypothetical protein
MNGQKWGKMPCWWQTQPWIHRLIRRTAPGAAIAALKLYIAFCMRANFNPQQGLPAGCVKLPLARLSRLVGLSKPMVILGLRALQEWGLVRRLSQRPAIYQLHDYMTCDYWTKIPSGYLYGGREGIALLVRMSSRGSRRLLALQMYLYLAAIRNARTQKARVSYDKLSEVLGVGRNEISAAISMLVEDELVTVRVADAAEVKNLARPSNEYWLRGSKVVHTSEAAAE